MGSGKIFKSLPFRLIVGVALGIVIGMILSSTDVSSISRGILNVLVTFRYIASQFINFCVPLIIIGFIAPSITRLGGSASRMLGVALILAYVSSVLAAFASMVAGYVILPFLNISSSTEGMKELPALLFRLDIPAVMSVMSALVLSIVVGLTAAWVKTKAIINILEEFQKLVLAIVEHFVIPLLPVYIFASFSLLSYEGTIAKQLPVFISIIVIVIIGHYIWLALLYGVAGAYSKKNPFAVLKNYGPAYLTAIGTMSSAATLSVALECAKKSEPPLRRDLTNFGIPLFANIHLCGSVLTETFFVMAVSKILYGSFPELSTMILFCILLAVFAIGAPGVPGGTVVASLGLIISVLGFDEAGTALMLTIFALQDSFGTACNVTGDGALTLILTGYAEKHGISEQPPEIDLGAGA